MLAWDDYRLVLAVARAGKLSGAAERLGVTLSTVFRRLERIEGALGARLFDRQRGTYEPTESGRELVRAAERMEEEARAGDRAVTGRDQRLTGTLRVTATEVLATSFLARHVPAFRAKHPGLLVEIISENRHLSLADREADVALRPRRPKEESLVGRKIGNLRWGVYASSGVCEELGAVTELSTIENQGFIGWEGSPAANEVMAWLDRSLPDAEIQFSSSSLITNAAVAASSQALALLPCLLGSAWPGLGTVLAPLPRACGELWIVTHEDLRRNARVRTLLDSLTSAARADRRRFEGEERS